MPELRYTLLPPYVIPNIIIISGVLVENLSAEFLDNVRVHIEYHPAGSRIHHMQILCSDEYVLRGGGVSHSFATLRLRRMRPGSQLVVYFAASRPVTPVVTVTSCDDRLSD